MSKEIRVLQLIDSLEVGGAEVLAVNIFNLLSENVNIESFLCATRAEGNLKNQVKIKDNYLFLQKRNTIDFSAVIRLRKFIKRNNIQIVHAHSTSFFLAFCIKICTPSLKVIWHDHYGNSDFIADRKSTLLEYASYKFAHIISVNSKLEKWAKQKLHCKEVTFLNNFPFFNDLKKSTKLKGAKGKRIVHVAAFRPQKDHINLLNGFLQTQDQYPDWSLHLIGDSNDDKYKNEIARFVNENNLKNKVFRYGVCSDIKYILSQASIGILASKSEGLPISLLEYGLAKLPVIVTNVGECHNVVKHNSTGLVVQKGDSEKLSKSILNLISSEKKRNQFGVELYSEIKKNYAKESYINKLIKIYKTILC